MRLSLKRIARRDAYTIGRLYVDGVYYCDTAEPRDRDENKDGKIAYPEKKVPGKTAIPVGTYRVAMKVQSPKFSRYPQYARCKGYLPRLLDVPGFDGVLIHIGNDPTVDSAGCILVGRNRQVGKVLDSKATFWPLYDKLKAADERGETIFVTVS